MKFYHFEKSTDRVFPVIQPKVALQPLHAGSGFGSKLNYGSGFFHSRLKIPGKDSAGVITAFYLSSQDNYGHDELDLEFLGNTEGKPITLQTNVFVDGVGGREQRIYLWFDPTSNFHTYKILWNPFQIVFYVEDIPIRVLKNNRNVGMGYPSHPMQMQASLWNGDWATDGGRTKINWAFAPFKANFQEFDISGCPSQTSNIDPECYSSNYWWNTNEYWNLNSTQQRQYEKVRKNYMYYDYCTDRDRYPTPPPECFYV
ncbi:hypothetical protein Pint_01539 [Pistacia integerrima]|uniref:Uncharacterized protein n=1 Tax=Pistacia integerrima TaxID=434235 RepID=A0ACC0ZNM8_9ROSI|nr:hypothetical protein Pint_01539 [Pistacia integerrima]